MKNMNLDESVINWVESYLMERQQRVYANDLYSSYQTITQGVPQGSVLSPLFYIIYVNDLYKIFKNCKFALYAGDTVLYISDNDIAISVKKLQEDIDALSAWCINNGITVITNKTKVMIFGNNSCLAKIFHDEVNLNFGQATLQDVMSYTYLGLTLDNHYNAHVNKSISSVTSKLTQFRRMRKFLYCQSSINGLQGHVVTYSGIW